MKKVFSTIKHFILSKKVLSAVIGVAMIGGVSAAGILSSNLSSIVSNVSSNGTASTMSVLDTSSVSSATSSEVSSEVSSALSSAPDVQAQDVSSSTVSTVDNTEVRTLAIQDENSRHAQALIDINTLYDPQVAGAKAKISDYMSKGAADTDKELQALIEQNSEYLQEMYYISQINATNSQKEKSCEDLELSRKADARVIVLRAEKVLYVEMVAEQTNLENLNQQKVDAVNKEIDNHSETLALIP